MQNDRFVHFPIALMFAKLMRSRRTSSFQLNETDRLEPQHTEHKFNPR
ncbi:unnamed protein product [Tenebrio molitor]|nr:unnamed protein product [Tenebrio molitor]